MKESMNKLLFFAMLLVLLLSGIHSDAQEKPANNLAGALREPMLVTVDWLTDHLGDPSVVLLQIGEKKIMTMATFPAHSSSSTKAFRRRTARA
jgi:hypothetical protein